MTTATLFQTEIEAALKPLYPGVEFDLTQAGRHVTGSMRIAETNPLGRKTCAINYTRRAYWTDDHERIALQVAGHWFKVIGGIGILKGKQLGHIVSSLRIGHSEQPMHWAIDAYAEAAWHRENKQWMGLGKFFHSDAFDTWLHRSDGYRRASDERERVLACERGRDRELKRYKHEEQERVALTDIAKIPNGLLRLCHARKRNDEVANRAADKRARHAAFNELDARAQSALIKRCRLCAHQTPPCYGIDTSEPKWWERIKTLGMDNDIFALAVSSQALFMKADRDGVTVNDLIEKPPPTQPWPPLVVDQEVKRRALFGCEWLAGHYPKASPETHELQYAAVELKIQCWLDDKPFPNRAQLPKLKATLETKAVMRFRDRHAAGVE